MIRPFLAVLASVLCSQAAPHPSLPGQVVPYGLGVNIHFTDPAEGEMELLAAAGFRWVRMDFSWAGTERERGVYDFSAYDRLSAHLTEHGMKALFILDYGNKLYESDSSVRTEQGREAFARWAAAAVKHFDGRGYLWEIWNEPNISFWKPEPNVDDYAALANSAAKAIHDAVPSAAVIGPATSGIDQRFISGCFERGTLDGWAAVSVHPYRQTSPEGASSEYRDLRQLIRKYAPAGREIPILSGEWGYSAAWNGYNEDLQGVMLARQFLTNLSNGIPLSIWYDWKDDGTDPKEPEHHFGTVGHPETKDGKPYFRLKPAYLAARTLTNTLKGYHFSKRLAFGSAEDHVLLFENGSKQIVACWTEAEAREVMFPDEKMPPCRALDHLGNKSTGLRTSYGVILTKEPIYLLFDGMVESLAKHPAFPEFSAELIRIPGGKFIARIDNPELRPFEGEALLYRGMNPERLAFKLDHDRSLQIEFKTRFDTATLLNTTLTIEAAGHRVLQVPDRTYASEATNLFERCHARQDGDPKIGGTQSLRRAESETPPFPGMAVWELKCVFEAGWRFITLTPKEPIAIFPNEPKAFGFWVHGDASGVQLRLRVKDANGRVWQPDGCAVDWKGWKHVRVPLKPTDARWGGHGEEVLRYPLQWDAVFLVDNTSRKALQTRLLVTPPTIEE